MDMDKLLTVEEYKDLLEKLETAHKTAWEDHPGISLMSLCELRAEVRSARQDLIDACEDVRRVSRYVSQTTTSAKEDQESKK